MTMGRRIRRLERLQCRICLRWHTPGQGDRLCADCRRLLDRSLALLEEDYRLLVRAARAGEWLLEGDIEESRWLRMVSEWLRRVTGNDRERPDSAATAVRGSGDGVPVGR